MNNSINTQVTQHDRMDTSDIIHGVKITSYNSVGDEISSSYIEGQKLHEYVYNCKTKKFVSLSSYEKKRKKFVGGVLGK